MNTAKSILTKEVFSELQTAVLHGNIDLDDVRNRNDIMRRNQILKVQKDFYTIWQATDGRWKTKVPDPSTKSGVRLLAKSKRENLENSIIEHYKKLEDEEKTKSSTIFTLYPIWKEQQKNKGRSSRTIRIYDDFWRKYYKDSAIVNIPINKLNVGDLEDWCYSLIRTYSMNKKKYNNVTVIIRNCFKIAYKRKIISENEFSKIEIESFSFADAPVYKNDDRVFLKSEKAKVTQLAFDDYYTKHSLACLGIVLCFEIGCRLGELVALKWEDISYNIENHICIRRMESKIEKTDKDGNYLPAIRKVVNHTKTKNSIRDVYLSEHAREILNMIKEWHRQHNINCEYIFVNEQGQRLYSTAFDSRIEKYCEHLGIKVKRMHAIRRSYISTLFDGGVNISTIQKQCGHADKQTTLNCYVYDTSDLEERTRLIEKALQQ